MRDVLLAFGRGLVKVLISLLIGAGAGLLALGIAGRDKPDLWKLPGPQPEVLLGVGVGLLTAGALMAVLFLFSRRRTPDAERDHAAARTSRSEPAAEHRFQGGE
jgi:hypothetical protein